jgi:glycosyltransferase involved in cell wall biosynthesis
MFADLLHEETDILHANNIQVLTTLVARVVHRARSRSRLVLSPFYHGRGHTRLAQMLWIPYRRVAKNIVRNANAIIVNSESQKSLIKRSFDISVEMYKVYDGVSLQEIRDTEPYDFDEELKILLYVGRLEKYKNIHLTIKALEYLPSNYSFYVIGRGPFRSELEKLVHSLNLADRVHFLGYQPDEVVYRWMKTADVFLHLSAVESFGMTCIESLAAGTPVVANEDGLGLSETIHLYPRDILPYKAEKDRYQKLAGLVQEAASLKPIKVDVSSFSWDSIAAKMSNIYEQMMNG